MDGEAGKGQNPKSSRTNQKGSRQIQSPEKNLAKPRTIPLMTDMTHKVDCHDIGSTNVCSPQDDL